MINDACCWWWSTPFTHVENHAGGGGGVVVPSDDPVFVPSFEIGVWPSFFFVTGSGSKPDRATRMERKEFTAHNNRYSRKIQKYTLGICSIGVYRYFGWTYFLHRIHDTKSFVKDTGRRRMPQSILSLNPKEHAKNGQTHPSRTSENSIDNGRLN